MKIYKSDSVEDFINFMKEHESLDDLYACEIDGGELEDTSMETVAQHAILNSIIHLCEQINEGKDAQMNATAVEKLSNAYVNLTE